MILLKPLDALEKKYSINEEDNLFRGSCGKIYLDKNDFIKVPFDFHTGKLTQDKNSFRRLYEEAKMQDFAVSLDIKLPDVYGFFAVKENGKGIYYPGLAMRNLGDLTLNTLEGSLRKKVESQRDFEIEKARDLGFVCNDNHDENVVWVPEEEQTYLLDCGLWKFNGGIN